MSGTMLNSWKKLGAVALGIMFAASVQATLIMHYTWDTGNHSGNVVYDQSATGLYDADDGGELVVDDADRGLVVEMSNDRIFLNVNNMVTTTDFTMSMWYKGTDTSGRFFDTSSVTRFFLPLGEGDSYVAVYLNDTFFHSTVPTADIADDAWHHLVWALGDNVTDSQYTLYVDGVDWGTTVFTGRGIVVKLSAKRGQKGGRKVPANEFKNSPHLINSNIE